MVNERSDRVWQSAHEASEKFDYFVAGLGAALTAFVAKELPSANATTGPILVEAVSAAMLCGSVAFSMLRIRANVVVLAASHRYLYFNEARGRLVALLAKGSGTQLINESTGETFSMHEAQQRIQSFAEQLKQIEDERERWNRKAERSYFRRDVSLTIGLGLYVAARVWLAYSRAPAI